MINVQIEKSWLTQLSSEFEKDYMKKLSLFLKEEKKTKTIYPLGSKIFNAFNLTPFSEVKVVILGQDPYHGPNQANGLSFSVNKSFPIPPSLKNIFKELFDDLGIQPSNSGCLERWSNQGVLLLNTYLTVERGKPGSHRNIGWERFTDYVLSKLNENKKNIVYLLWGKHAQEKAKIINSANNKIIMSAHPSPYSANYGFFGSRPFSKANDFLVNTNQTKINW